MDSQEQLKPRMGLGAVMNLEIFLSGLIGVLLALLVIKEFGL